MVAPRSPVLALLLLCWLSACVAPGQQVRPIVDDEAAVSMLARVQIAAFPLLLASADWCPFDQEPTYGFLIQNRPGSLAEDGAEAAKGIVITQVYDRSPAARAGLRVGDQVLAINTQDVAAETVDRVADLIHRLTLARIQPLQLDVARSEQRVQVYLEAVPACQFSLGLFRTEIVNALSNGRQIGVTTGLMRFVQSDDELAWVLAHEIAHNVLGHVPEARLRVMLNAWLGATVGEPAAPSPPPRPLEAQADYVGAYFMARAGYDLQAVRRFWQRLGQLESQQATSTQGLERSHPTTDERLAVLDATLKEIEDKRARGEALEPLIRPR